MSEIGPTLKRYSLPALALLIPFLLYFATTARDIYWLDSAEFVVVTAINGLAHPPGYPLLLWLLETASLLPVFSLPFRLNLISALFAALSCFVLFLILRRLTKNGFAALLGSLIWMASYELWQQATAIEVYSLQALLVGLALFTACGYSETGLDRRLLLLAFVLGLGFANHLFIVFWIPGIGVILYFGTRQRPNPRTILLSILLFLLGPLLYLTLLFRTPNLPGWAGIDNLKELLGYVTARIYRYRLLAGGTSYLATQLKDLPKTVFQQFTIFWTLLIPGIIGMGKHHPQKLLGLLTGVIIAGLAALFYNIPDKEGYFLVVWFGFAVIIGYGGWYLLQIYKPIAALIIFMLIASLLFFYPKQDRSHLRGVSDLARAVRAELPDGAILFTDDYTLYHGIHWLNLETKNKPRLTVISQYHLALPWYLKQLSSSLPVPPGVFELARNLWHNPVRWNDINFGELARQTASEIMHILILSLQPKRIFFFPQNFTNFLETWQGYNLKLNGLTYEFVKDADSLIEPPDKLQIPGPRRYNTRRFYDPYTVDLCRRFAATVNRRGMMRYARGDVLRALSDFNLSLEYFPDYPAAIENKGLVYAFEGQADSAKFYLHRFLELDPHSVENEKVKSILNRLSP